jgi:hypothetical protein
MSPVLTQVVDHELRELADGHDGRSVQTGGKLFSKKKKRGGRAKAPAPGARVDDEEPDWMRIQKQQQATSCEIPSIASGLEGSVMNSDLEWAMIRKLQHQKDEEGQREPHFQPPLPADIPVLPLASHSAAAFRDSDLGGWKMVRKTVAPSPPLNPLPPPRQQQHGLLEISDGVNVLGGRDVDGGFFERRSAGAAKAKGTSDLSMDVEDYDE